MSRDTARNPTGQYDWEYPSVGPSLEDMSAQRLVYDDPDTTQDMAKDATACCAEAHLARAASAFTAARRTVDTMPATLLAAPRKVTRSVVNVSDGAAKFAGQLFD